MAAILTGGGGGGGGGGGCLFKSRIIHCFIFIISYFVLWLSRINDKIN